MWRSLVARFVRDEEVVGSNPAIPTLQLTGEVGRRSPAPSSPAAKSSARSSPRPAARARRRPSAGLNVGAGRFSPPGDTRAGEVAGASRLRARLHQVVDVGPAVAPHGRRPQPQARFRCGDIVNTCLRLVCANVPHESSRTTTLSGADALNRSAAGSVVKTTVAYLL